MRFQILSVFCLFLLARIGTAQYVTIPDANFKTFLKAKYPTCFNSQDMLDTTCTAVLRAKNITISSSTSVVSLQGIQYFKGLDTLNCESNTLTNLSTLPASLKLLECRFNQLSSLPTLPASLTFLACGYNRLSSLPALPASLGGLSCVDNRLTSLPALPASLVSLSCGTNRLTSLPALPASLITLFCDNNQLTSLPSLPATLKTLNCNTNFNLNCLPTLPLSLTNLSTTSSGIACLPNKPAGLTSSLPICAASSPCVLGIEEGQETSLLVSPNPVTENCWVNYNTEGKQGTLILTDALGRGIKSVELQGSGKYELSVLNMPTGLYYLRVNVEGQILATGKIVVNK
jgi:hypothetical protein